MSEDLPYYILKNFPSRIPPTHPLWHPPRRITAPDNDPDIKWIGYIKYYQDGEQDCANIVFNNLENRTAMIQIVQEQKCTEINEQYVC